MTEPKDPTVIYHDQLNDAVDELETLQDRESFDRLLRDTAIEQTHAMEFHKGPDAPYIHLAAEDMPAGFADKMLFPKRFWVHGVEAQLTELLEAGKGLETPDWTLLITLQITEHPQLDPIGNRLTFTCTPLETVCTTTNRNGDPVVYRTEARAGQQLLLGILGSVLTDEAPEDLKTQADFQSLMQAAPLSPSTIENTIEELGQRFGQYKKRTLSYLPHPDHDDRAVVVNETVSEDLGTNSRTIDFYMNSQLASGLKPETAKHTASLALKFEDIRHDDIVLSALEHHYAKRYPTDIPVEDMAFAFRMGMFESTEGKLFDPYEDREQYSLNAAAIMTVLRPYLKHYSKYDATDAALLGPDTYNMPDPSNRKPSV